MKRHLFRKKIQDFKKNSRKKRHFIEEEESYKEINSRSFDYSFNVLIHHYKKAERSAPAKPE